MIAAAAALVALCAPSVVQEPALYAALPVRNLSPDRDAPEALRALVSAELSARGARLVDDATLDDVLLVERIRYTDSVDARAARALTARTGATYLLHTVVLESVRGDEPVLAVALRTVDAATGARLQSAVVALRGADFEGLLGLGRIESWDELARDTVARLMLDFRADGRPKPRAPRGAGGGEAVAHVQRDFDLADVGCVVLLPFVNRSNDPGAAELLADLLAHAWFEETGVRVVEPGELRSALARERIRSLAALDLDALGRVARAVGATHVVLGAVDRYAEQVFVQGEPFPEIEVSMRILDVGTGFVVADAAVRRRGDDGLIVLGLGAEHDAVALALAAARDLVGAIGS